MAQHLLLPHEHDLSLRIAAAVAAANIKGDTATSGIDTPGLVHARVISPGLVELTLQAGGSSGYGYRAWRVRVGGAGLGDDANDALARLGLLVPRAPIAVRFAVPIALHGVDDAGFCNASFWSNNKCRPTAGTDPLLLLKGIVETAVQWLEGSHEQGNSEEWKDTERHAREGFDVIRTYAAIRGKKELTASTSPTCSPSTRRPLVLCNAIEPEWIVPALRPCFTSSEDLTSINNNYLTVDWAKLATEIGPGIYSFDLFTPAFCDLFIAEVDAFEATKLHCRRPNTMNRLGLVVTDIGLEPLLTDLLERCMAPMCQTLYGSKEDAAMITSALDHHHSFVVRYRATDSSAATIQKIDDDDDDDGTRGLDMHHDASEATLNICLGRDNFTSGGLRFCGRFGDANHRTSTQTVVSHTKGTAILHLGRHRHGADDIGSGERINLILWARNSAYRGAAAFGHVPLDGTPQKKELGMPDKLCLSKSNDRDYEEKMKLLDMTKIVATAAGQERKTKRKITKF